MAVKMKLYGCFTFQMITGCTAPYVWVSVRIISTINKYILTLELRVETMVDRKILQQAGVAYIIKSQQND